MTNLLASLESIFPAPVAKDFTVRWERLAKDGQTECYIVIHEGRGRVGMNDCTSPTGVRWGRFSPLAAPMRDGQWECLVTR
jgi:hypothetical protein